MRYTLGGGVAGLTKAFFDKSTVVFDKSPLGQIGSKYILGPRIIKVDPYTQYFFDRYFKNCSEIVKSTIKILYDYGDGVFVDKCDDEFKRKYSFITRGKEEYEPSFLSSGQTEIEVFIHRETDLYRFVFEHFLSQVKDRIIAENIVSIDTVNRNLVTESKEKLEWDKLTSTLNMNILRKLVDEEAQDELDEYDFSTEPKNFIVSDQSDDDRTLALSGVHYVYSIGGLWTRKTIQDGYTVYETVDQYLKQAIEGLRIRQALNGIPIQIKNSLNLEEFRGIKLLGRYAQWNHSIKFNEVLQRVLNQ